MNLNLEDNTVKQKADEIIKDMTTQEKMLLFVKSKQIFSSRKVKYARR